MTQEFDEPAYIGEMIGLVDQAIQTLTRLPEVPEIYTVSIWTDPDAAASAICIDTFDNSQRFVQNVNEFNARERERWLSEGDAKMAALFSNATRNDSPADFQYRDLAECDHLSFEGGWEEDSGGTCWELLEPALKKVAALAVPRFRKLPLHPDAELAVNGRGDWYETTFPLAAG